MLTNGTALAAGELSRFRDRANIENAELRLLKISKEREMLGF